MRKILRAVIYPVIVVILVALPVFAQSYEATVQVTEVSGNDYGMLALTTPLNTTFLVNQNIISASGLDTRVTDGATYSHMLADDRVVFALPVPAHSSNPMTFSTGTTALTSFDIITGYNGFVTMNDAVALEPGNNFEFWLNGYLNTTAGTNTNFLSKAGAVNIFTETSGTVIGDIMDGPFVAPTGFVDAAAGWNNEANAYDGNIATAADSNAVGAGLWSEFLEITRAATIINSFRVDAVIRTAGDEIDVDAFYGGAWHDVYEGVYAAHLTWNRYYLTHTETVTSIRFRWYNNAGGPLTALLYEVEWSEGTRVSGAMVSGAGGDIQFGANGANLNLWLDTVLVDTVALAGISVPDNANDFIIGQGNTTPSLNWFQYRVGGVLTVEYEPVAIISGTTLPDLVGVAQDGVITWGVNPAGVGVVFNGLVPVDTYQAAVEPQETPSALGELTQPEGMFPMTEDSVAEAWPWLQWLTAVSLTTDTPIFFFFVFLNVLITLIIMGVLAKNTKNLWMTGLGMCVGVGIGIAMGVFPPWILILSVLGTVGTAVMERSPTL